MDGLGLRRGDKRFTLIRRQDHRAGVFECAQRTREMDASWTGAWSVRGSLRETTPLKRAQVVTVEATAASGWAIGEVRSAVIMDSFGLASGRCVAME